MLQHQRNRIGRNKRIVKSQRRQHPKWRARCKVQRSRQHRRASSLRLPTSARATLNPFSVSNSSRLYPETRRGMRGNFVLDQSAYRRASESSTQHISRPSRPPPRIDALQLLRTRPAHSSCAFRRRARSPAISTLSTIFAAQQAMHAAAVVADHSAQCAALWLRDRAHRSGDGLCRITQADRARSQAERWRFCIRDQSTQGRSCNGRNRRQQQHSPHCPARLVPAPRGNTAAPTARHASSAASTSASSRGRITPMGSWR